MANFNKLFQSRLFKVAKHSNFEYKPRFSDDEEEREEDRKSRMKIQRGAIYDKYEMQDQLRERVITHRKARNAKSRMITMLILLVAMLVVAYLAYTQSLGYLIILLMLIVAFLFINNKH